MEDIFSLAKVFHGRQAAELKNQVSEWQVPKRLIEDKEIIRMALHYSTKRSSQMAKKEALLPDKEHEQAAI